MKVITFASQKGGSGKSTLCTSLAVTARLDGAQVLLLDLDPQGSCAAWIEARDQHDWIQEDGPNKVYLREVTPTALDRWMQDARKRNLGDLLVLVDTQGTAADEVKAALRHADMVIVPVQPSAHDMRALGRTVGMLQEFAKDFAFVLNRASPLQPRETEQAVEALAGVGPVAGVVSDRADFRRSAANGLGVAEGAPGSKAEAEIAALWSWIKAKMGDGDGNR